MAQIEYSYYSEVLKTKKKFILLGELDKNINDVFFIFHGVGGDCYDFLNNTRLNKIANDEKIIAVLLDIDRSFLATQKNGYDYLKYVDVEIFNLIKNTFKIDLDNTNNYTLGFSMGGYASYRLLLNSPGKYLGCASISGSMDIISRDFTKRLNDDFIAHEWASMFGDKISDEYDLFKASLIPNLNNHKLYMTIGNSDELKPFMTKYSKHLIKHNIKHIYEIDSGEHDYNFVDSKLTCAIKKLKGSND